MCPAQQSIEDVFTDPDVFPGNHVKGFDASDPFTYMKRCIFPYLKNPNTITTNQTLITMKVDVKSTFNFKVNVETTILVVCHQDDMETSFGIPKTDYLAGEIRKALYNIKDGT